MTSYDDFELEEKRLAIIKKQAELDILKQEYVILEKRAMRQKNAINGTPKEQEFPQEKECAKKGSTIEQERSIEKYRDDYPTLNTQLHYVVTQGPRMGIYNDQVHIKNLPQSYFSVATSKEQAESLYQKVRESKIRKDTLLKLQSILPSEKADISQVQSALISKTISKEEWEHLHQQIQDPHHPHYIPVITRGGHLKTSVQEGADPEYVLQLFAAGLINNIYPGEKLEELSKLGRLQESIAIYAKRTNKKNIFVNIISSIPDWEEGRDFPPHYLIKLGAMNQKYQNKNLPDIYDDNKKHDFTMTRVEGLYFIVKELEKINEESKVKVNYWSNNILVLSKFNKTVSNQDLRRIRSFEDNIVQKKISVSHVTKELIDFLPPDSPAEEKSDSTTEDFVKIGNPADKFESMELN